MMSSATYVLLSLPVLVGMARGQDGPPKSPAGAAGTSRTVLVTDGATVDLRVRVSEPTKNILTVVTLPSPIREVVSAWNEKDLSAEHSGERLFLKLLAHSQGHLDIVLTTGRHVRLYIAPAKEGELFDAGVLVREDRAPGAESRSGRGSGALELVRAMRLGEVPAGVTVRRAKDETLFESQDALASLSWVYDAAFFRGYIVRLSNRSGSVGYEVDLPRLHAEDLVLVGARNLGVEPKSYTYLYLVFWKK